MTVHVGVLTNGTKNVTTHPVDPVPPVKVKAESVPTMLGSVPQEESVGDEPFDMRCPVVEKWTEAPDDDVENPTTYCEDADVFLTVMLELTVIPPVLVIRIVSVFCGSITM